MLRPDFVSPQIAPASQDGSRSRGAMRPHSYNSTHQKMWTLRPIATCWLLVTIALPQRASAQAERWAAPCSTFSSQIAALAGPGPATLVVRNSSSISADQLATIRHLVESDLNAGGVSIRTGSEGSAIPTSIRITLSQNTQHGLWIAEVRQGNETRVAMVEIPLERGLAAQATPRMTLHKELDFTSPEPILDAEVLSATSGPQLLILTATHIASYRQAADGWQQIQNFSVNPRHTPSRDPRGVLLQSGSGIRAYLPGVVCDASSIDGSTSFQCNESDDPWPIGSQKAFYNSSRNYFSGVLVPAYSGVLPPFYSAAEFERASGPATLFVDIRGPVRMLDHGALTDVVGSRDWGSNLTSIHSGCGSGMQILADAAGDPPQDSVRAYEVNGHEAGAVSAPLTFEGSVTAMHAAADRTSAFVIVRSALNQPAAYEVWHVLLDCH